MAGASALRDASRAPALHVVVAAPPTIRALADLAALDGAADLIELRLDLLPWGEAHTDVSLQAWIEASPRPVLATLRSTREGGAFEGAPADAAAILRRAWEAGAAWVDAENDVVGILAGAIPPERVVLSRHGPHALEESASQHEERLFGLHKCALAVDDAATWSRCLEDAGAAPEAGRRGGRFLVPYGTLGSARGAFFDPREGGLLFGGSDAASAVVPGQPALSVLLDELRAGEVSPRARLFGLVGTPPVRSPSPAMHNSVFRHLQADALYVPLPGLSLSGARQLPLLGFSVTHPYKREAHAAAQHLDESARASGSVNTLIRAEGDAWTGFDTDTQAIAALSLPASASSEGAVVYGTGGYARAAVHALQTRGYSVRVIARNPEAAEGLGTQVVGTSYHRQPSDRIVFNATPAGASGEALPAFADADLEGLHVFDAPYRVAAAATGLVVQARAQGAAEIIDGHALLLRQALGQSRLFQLALLAQEPSQGAAEALAEESALAVLRAGLEPPPSLYLLGTRGAGKSTVGREVARMCGRPFVDLDDEITRISGATPREWIEGQGWEAFRNIESDALARVCVRRGVVVALGGGIVEREANRKRLSMSGVKIWLQVDAATAARRIAGDTVERPLHEGCTDPLHEARVLLRRRKDAWEGLSDYAVDARLPLAGVAQAVADCWDQHRP